MTRARAPAFLAAKVHGLPLHRRARAQVRQRRAGIRFRHGDRDDAFAGDDLRDEALAQGFGREMRNGEDGAKARLEDGKGDGRRDLGEFLEHDDGIEMGKAVSAISFRKVDAQVAERGVARHHVGRDRFIVLFELFRERRQLRLREFSRRIAQVFLLFRQTKIHDCSAVKGAPQGDTGQSAIKGEG